MKLWMQGRLPTEQPDPVPLVITLDTVTIESVNLLKRHAVIGGCLATGSVTARAAQITNVSEIDFQ